jgi:hypothetical protein
MYLNAIIIGLIGIALSFFIPIARIRIPVQLISVLAVAVGAHFSGVDGERAVWQERMNAAKLEIAVLEQRA